MFEQILKTIQKFNMLERGDNVVVGLSGGADSVCLLLSLCSLRDELGITVAAMHVNHCLRGAESDSDEEFCRDLCSRLDIEFISKRFDINGIAAQTHKSVEQAARDVRYDFFAKNSINKKIATAHNANDNAETIIFNLTRGTGLKGICGIPPVRDNIIRPLIETSREQIEAFLAGRSQPYVTDSTNLSDDYTRNKLRHYVIPVLASINSGLYRTITADSDNFRMDNSYIEMQSQNAYVKCLGTDGRLSGLADFHQAIRHRCIAKLLSEHHIEPDNKKISDIDYICINGGKINLSKNVYIISKSGILYIEILNKPADDYFEIPLSEGENNFKNIKKITVRLTKEMPQTDNAVIDAGKIVSDAYLHSRRSGDRIRLNKKGFTSSVKKLLNEKIPSSQRNSLCFLSDKEGLFYIENIGYSQRVAVSESTENYMEIIVSNL
ncbi:MAG: tRNA lysidine(34) synthetase TilS [Oscillospiraceae bacterium]|nr:tRNA lysidine(34) synthetase TilS [Oscillospiraceae bacterium]